MGDLGRVVVRDMSEKEVVISFVFRSVYSLSRCLIMPSNRYRIKLISGNPTQIAYVLAR